jgi:hypothetical protein
MKKWLVIAFFALCLTGCPGISGVNQTQVQEASVASYEGVALSLNLAKGFIKGKELSGQLKGAELDAVILKWEQARTLFLQAGDALAASIVAPTPTDRAAQVQKYNVLLMKAGQMAGEIQGGK